MSPDDPDDDYLDIKDAVDTLAMIYPLHGSDEEKAVWLTDIGELIAMRSKRILGE